MKKIFIFVLMLMCLTVFAFGGPQKKLSDYKPRAKDPDEPVTKSYVLKHVAPKRVHDALKEYFYDDSYDRNSNIITVKIPRKNIKDFERMLKLMDVAKKKVMLRIFAIIASREGKSTPIANKDLKKVLTELQKVLSFNSYRLDGVSAMTVIDGQQHSHVKLTASANLNLYLGDVYVRKDGDVNTTGFEFRLQQQVGRTSEGKPLSEILLSSETSVKENGYLVAGVSKIGKNGDSLVLIINAKML